MHGGESNGVGRQCEARCHWPVGGWAIRSRAGLQRKTLQRSERLGSRPDRPAGECQARPPTARRCDRALGAHRGAHRGPLPECWASAVLPSAAAFGGFRILSIAPSRSPLTFTPPGQSFKRTRHPEDGPPEIGRVEIGAARYAC